MKLSKLFFWFLGLVLAVFFIITLCQSKFLLFSDTPNIILITVDALRFDHLSCYGYERKTSPNIDKLAEEGVTFLNYFTTSSATLNATPGLFSGRYLQIMYRTIYYNLFDGHFTTLTEYLKGFNYTTAAFIGNGNYKFGVRFEQGFD